MEKLADQLIRKAQDRGATGVECTISEGEQFSVNVRMGEVESLTEASSKGVGLRVLSGQRTGAAYTSDFTEEGLERMLQSALELAEITTDDPDAGLPAAEELGMLSQELELYSATVAEISATQKIAMAKAAEAAALGHDPRIENSEGASFDTHLGRTTFANSLGFIGSYATSSCSMSTVPVAKQDGAMQRDYWFTTARRFDRLESPETVGKKAAERAIRRLGARKVATQKVPVVFEPRVARSLLDNIFSAISGDSIYRGESFLAGKLGEVVADSKLSVVNDATLPGLFGSAPFDDEGVPSRRTVIIEQGRLQNYLLNSYTARKLGMRTTGSASRGLTGNAHVGHGNFYVEKGVTEPGDIIKSIKTGLYVTELIGFGFNVVTGDYSRGAAGMWIENGELAFPVAEITVASTLQAMLQGLEAIGSDLEFRGSMASPTLCIREMTVSGQ
jgi:PmbA protein